MNVLLDECFAPDVADRLGELLPEWECDSVYEVDLAAPTTAPSTRWRKRPATKCW